MHLAIGMWALLAGGVILPSGNDGTNSSLPPVVGPYVSPTNVDAPQPSTSAAPQPSTGTTLPSPAYRPADMKRRDLLTPSPYRYSGYGTGYAAPPPWPRFMPWRRPTHRR